MRFGPGSYSGADWYAYAHGLRSEAMGAGMALIGIALIDGESERLNRRIEVQ